MQILPGMWHTQVWWLSSRSVWAPVWPIMRLAACGPGKKNLIFQFIWQLCKLYKLMNDFLWSQCNAWKIVTILFIFKRETETHIGLRMWSESERLSPKKHRTGPMREALKCSDLSGAAPTSWSKCYFSFAGDRMTCLVLVSILSPNAAGWSLSSHSEPHSTSKSTSF